ncbi:MAG TPA: hypothetical protein VK487_05945 [Candidatus Bathyarchaeia archaeon]|nr:hypothetical protein [Candidatus Bathyarchaeia archaeon]
MAGIEKIVVQPQTNPKAEVLEKIRHFLKDFSPVELRLDAPLVLFQDKRSNAFYLFCHLDAKTIVSKADLDAVLDPMESEDYKLNRELYLDTYAYRKMEEDAILGRGFEDLVIEYDAAYRPQIPLKVYGGQHRIKAIAEAVKKGVSECHGIRVYFDLDRGQKLDIAVANNTAIAISNDLLDRMYEGHLGPDLRNWCQVVGILEKDQDFADKRNPEGVPTVRVARTLLVDYFFGKDSIRDDFHIPIVCSSGPGIDENYQNVRSKIDWSDKNLIQMGREFAKLHRLQRERILRRDADAFIEFANKATHPCVTAAWAYAAGYLSRHFPERLPVHYALSAIEDGDPLNAKALLSARLKGIDPDTYRGLGARISGSELGRMLEVFLLQATRAKETGITPKLANAAIKSFEAKKAKEEAEKALKRL